MIEIIRPIIGIAMCQICAPKTSTEEELLKFANKFNPSGTTNGWIKVIMQGDEEYPSSQYPVQCDDIEENMHYLLVC